MTLNLDAALAALPPLDSNASSFRSQIREMLQSKSQQTTSKRQTPVLVALDDDPTGTQTCHDVAVLTVWDVATLASEFRRGADGFFILTNARALHPDAARALVVEVCSNLQTAARQADNTPFEIVLRGDSTLRGHFPLEPEAVESVLGKADVWVLCPFFLQGGRYTLDDVHYVADGNGDGGRRLVPAGETPFARDATFGYRSSNLRDWVVEKSKGRIAREDVVSLSLETIRTKGRLEEQLAALPVGKTNAVVVIVNAAAEEDVDAVVLALQRVCFQQPQKRYLFRTAATFVSSWLGIAPIAPLSAHDLGLDSSTSRKTGGLIVAGSYVPKTTAQLNMLIQRCGDSLTTIVLPVHKLLEQPQSHNTTAVPDVVVAAVATAAKEIQRGQDVLVMTSRELVVGADEAASLDIGAAVARALVAFLQTLETKPPPRYVIAKGGITSSDMATKGLRFRRAMIVGQAAPGVPLWRCDEPTCKWPGLPYVVFPGNVGGDEALYEVVKGWRAPKA